MKHSSQDISVRIKRFMDKKMVESPELREPYGPKVQVVQRGYLLEDLLGIFNRRVVR